ncbi:hypothetical protein ANCDUO_22354 [Ancylostoma duodenale]|uniref:Uncharacterized protein n=1 Tax=Ancylostoma duodenale TaxID=51022 RepID=A0A0C2BUG4_9BILA|nr:hypothetical protein ANCDUO_22354 [Ancylostoma duodenale]
MRHDLPSPTNKFLLQGKSVSFPSPWKHGEQRLSARISLLFTSSQLQIFALAGQEYEDVRLTKEQFAPVKPSQS